MINAVGSTMISAPCTPLTRATRSRHSLTWVTGSPESTMVSPSATMNVISASNDEPSIGDDQSVGLDRGSVPITTDGSVRRASGAGAAGTGPPGGRRRRVLLTTSSTTTSAISSTARAMSTVPRPIPDCAAAGGVAGTTVCTVEAGTVSTEFTVVVSTALLEVADEAVAEVAVWLVWLVATDDEAAAELTVELADSWDDLVDGELDEAALLCWPLVVDPSVSGAADSVPVGARAAPGCPCRRGEPRQHCRCDDRRQRQQAGNGTVAQTCFVVDAAPRSHPVTVDVTAAPSTSVSADRRSQSVPPPSRRRAPEVPGWTESAGMPQGLSSPPAAPTHHRRAAM